MCIRDRYTLVVDNPGRAYITLRAMSKPVHTYLYLEKAVENTTNKLLLEWTDSGDENGYSEIDRYLEVGTYTITTATREAGVNASYVVNVSGIEGQLYKTNS